MFKEMQVQGCWAFIVACVTVNENFLGYIFAFLYFAIQCLCGANIYIFADTA